MNLSRVQKVILGIFTFLPFLVFPIILYQVFHFVLDMIKVSEHGEPDPSDVMASVFVFIVPIILLTFGCLALLIFYLVHAVGNKKLESSERTLWILLFIFFGIIAFPIYWILQIWNAKNSS